jgi:hypothetical protein
MKRVDLIEVKHERKIGSTCEYIEPNVTEDCIFYADGEPIGFYLTKMPEKMCKLADLANAEFQSKNVPKSLLERSDVMTKTWNDKSRSKSKRNGSNVKYYRFNTT